MQIEAKWDWVVVKVESSETKTESGVIIDAGMGEGVERATVIATGIGKCLENGAVRPMQVKEGDYVLFQAGVGHPLMHKGVQYRVIKEEDICCQIHDETAVVEIPELRNKGQKYAPESKNIRLCTYDAEKRLLLVDFLSGGTYLYTDVPELVWRDLLTFPSAGQYLAKNIKPHFRFFKIDTENKVDEAQDEPVGEDRGENAQSTKGE